MNIIIADDEPLARMRLKRLLAELPDCQLIAEAANGQDLLTLAEDKKPDVVLVDIHMPGMDGLHAARRLGDLALPPAIIFTTAYSEHALSAFSTPASGYLLKPIKREQLQKALLQAAQTNRAQRAAHDDLRMPQEYIEVRERERQLRIPLHKVIYCLAEDKYTQLVWQSGRQLIDRSLRQLQAEHPHTLLRVHRKVLVNPTAVIGLEKHLGGLHLLLRNCADTPPVSRRQATLVRALLKS